MAETKNVKNWCHVLQILIQQDFRRSNPLHILCDTHPRDVNKLASQVWALRKRTTQKALNDL